MLNSRPSLRGVKNAPENSLTVHLAYQIHQVRVSRKIRLFLRANFEYSSQRLEWADGHCSIIDQ
jgi:hypothetical protein